MRKWICLLLLLVWLPSASCTPTAEAPLSETTEFSAQETEVDYGFANYEQLRSHYSKHGHEFGAISETEYLNLAKALRDAPVSDTVIQLIRADTVRTRFDRSTGNFIAFGSDRTIITFFRPNDGERYFERQATRPR